MYQLRVVVRGVSPLIWRRLLVSAELREPTDTTGNGPFSRFHLMPTCGAQYYAWTAGQWSRIYSEDLARGDKEQIVQVLTAGAKSLGLWESQTRGPILEERGIQITFSALGQAAPVESKTAWDPRGDKKENSARTPPRDCPDLKCAAEARRPST